MNSLIAINNIATVPSKLNKTENAISATKLNTARNINGTSFDGTSNITTANWGTARTLSIGNSSKSVNGSQNINWSLSEIGAAPESHTHSYLPLSGGTVSGDITYSRNSENTYFRAKRTDTGTEVSFGIGAGGTNHGLYSQKLGKWMVYGNDTNIFLNGKAESADKLNTSAGSTTQPVYFKDGKPVTCSSYVTKSSVGDIGWGSNNNSPVTVSSIAYWNGAYSETSSNLTYCNRGAFGTIVTKNAGDYLSSSGGTVSGKITTSQLAIGGKNLTIAGSAPGSPATGDIWIDV